MTRQSRCSEAFWETTKRLLAELINEGLAEGSVKTSKVSNERYLHLRHDSSPNWVKVGLMHGAWVEMRENIVISVIRPETLEPPVFIGHSQKVEEELDPSLVFSFVSPWFSDHANGEVLDTISRQLKNCAENQEFYDEKFHRLCYPQPPLEPVEIEEMLIPNIAFISVPRADLRLTGPFENMLEPLLERLKIPEVSAERVRVPCFTQQLPSILQLFSNATVLKSVAGCADAQASMRTLTLRPELNFGYHLKLSLACQITSALRTITPWTTCSGPFFTEVLERFLPADMWCFREVAAVTGGQEDFTKARHLSCILRVDLKKKAQDNDETLLVSAALAQKPYKEKRTYAEILFNLRNISQKLAWLKSYAVCLFNVVLPPLIEHGIGLEAHGQNIVARICNKTKNLKGFAVRDCGGVRLHVPTLRAHGVNFDSLPPGGATLTDDMNDVWSKVHHSLLQNHIGHLVYTLGLEREGGWQIVREALATVLHSQAGTVGEPLHRYFLKDTIPFKCFLRMSMEGKYRDLK
ncbi:hypothetical protein N7462_009121 [Penicillium macrosclerotiorum]|uniref:uncharacterized protein n=1 Tax=Penicillium macrosclerotiorum TaxID=303699 RepID=UPI0025470A2F|nr:uncharacterized protein N7462_009121 [Penicillium macrosclerotiorum]KAJ5676224.1 hypothetical protein N7462_009121 [Penicillium macrosclerotiorum]